MAARLKEMYASEVAPALQKKFGYKSVMQIPKFDKIVINVGCGEAKDNSKVVDAIMTSEESTATLSTAEATMLWVLKSSSYSPKSNTIR